jgi:hypothetical protein
MKYTIKITALFFILYLVPAFATQQMIKGEVKKGTVSKMDGMFMVLFPAINMLVPIGLCIGYGLEFVADLMFDVEDVENE